MPSSSAAQSPQRARRAAAAPLGLLLLGWSLGIGQLAHATLAHGGLAQTWGSDAEWVHHARSRREPSRLPPGHRHGHASTDHFKVAVGPVSPSPTGESLVLQEVARAEASQGAPSLARRWLTAQPQGP